MNNFEFDELHSSSLWVFSYAKRASKSSVSKERQDRGFAASNILASLVLQWAGGVKTKGDEFDDVPVSKNNCTRGDGGGKASYWGHFVGGLIKGGVSL